MLHCSFIVRALRQISTFASFFSKVAHQPFAMLSFFKVYKAHQVWQLGLQLQFVIASFVQVFVAVLVATCTSKSIFVLHAITVLRVRSCGNNNWQHQLRSQTLFRAMAVITFQIQTSAVQPFPVQRTCSPTTIYVCVRQLFKGIPLL